MPAILAEVSCLSNADEVERLKTPGYRQTLAEALALLKGTYTLSVFLFCERGLHIYDNADHILHLEVVQDGIEQGLFHVPRKWSTHAVVKS